MTSSATRTSKSGGRQSTSKSGGQPRKHATSGRRSQQAQAAEAHPGHQAASRVLESHGVTITLPDDLGTVRLFEPQRLAFYGGLALLAGFGIVEWPVAAVLGLGHMLAVDHNHKLLAEFGDALAEA